MNQARDSRKRRLCGLAVLLALVFLAGYARAQSAPLQSIPDLGRGAATLDGPWQFHLGDDASWAAPNLDDATGHNGWTQITADQPWGAQGYRSYVGYAWYRKHLSITAASGVSPRWSLLIPHIDDVYAIYWNGHLVATHGDFPPSPSWRWSEAAQTFDLGTMEQGVLAIRVYKYPLGSYQDGQQGGFYAPPVIGGAQAIAREKSDRNYSWLQQRQFAFGIDSLEALVLLLSFLFWWRDRSQRVLLWTALYCLTQLVLALALSTLRTPLSFRVAQGIDEPLQFLQDVALWFLLLWLLDLRGNERVMRWTRALVVVNFIFQFLDGAACILDWSRHGVAAPCQIADAIFTTIYTLTELWPIVLVILAVRNRLDRPRWAVAIFAFISELTNIVPIMLEQGSRFTHWTIGQTLHLPLFTVAGIAFDAPTLSSTALLLAIIYAVSTYSRAAVAQRQVIEQELKSAQELQQVLIPEQLPSLPGFAVTSGYRPAQEVGGDFFQIIPLVDHTASHASALIVLGDVSGKGLRAAMTVSLIVGSLRTLAESTSDPAGILAGLNRRLCGRLRDGFATCVAVKLDADGSCTIANAGHPSPFLNRQEVAAPGALPLGVTMGSAYEETTLRLRPGDHIVLYTDGLLEARNADGELFGFDRLCDLITTRPDAAQSIDAAVRFGQQDDITVLTITRLGVGEEARIQILAPALAPA